MSSHKPIHLFFLLQFMLGVSLVQLGCQKTVEPDPTLLISSQEFDDILKIDGHEFDSLIIENCTFRGGGLSIGDADNVVVRNCRFEDIRHNGIKVGFTGPASDILIEDCFFDGIGFNAIDSHREAPNGTIRGCTIKNAGLSETGTAMAQPHHGIYWKGKDVLIEENRFEAGNQPQGNAISVRSSGIVRKNVIIGAPKNGIMYYSNHPGSDSLLIEHNFLAYNTYGISCATLGNEECHNQNVIIRFKTVLQETNYNLYIAAGFQNTTVFSIYGNLFVNPTET
ncbi:MAG: right-handed parallel beta-helix repeat-containing protein [Crocinitomicaceae bacterium]